MFKTIAQMNKHQLIQIQANVQWAKDFINNNFMKIVVMIMLMWASISSAMNNDELVAQYSPMLIVSAAIVLATLGSLLYFLGFNKFLNFLTNYFERLIQGFDVQAVNDAFNNHNKTGYVFNYHFADPDRGDIVSVKYGKNAGNYVVKQFFDKNRGMVSVMINSVGVHPSDPRYKSLVLSDMV